MLSSEFTLIDNPLEEQEKVCGVYLLNQSLFIYGRSSWVKDDLRGNLEGKFTNPHDPIVWPILRKGNSVLVRGHLSKSRPHPPFQASSTSTRATTN